MTFIASIIAKTGVAIIADSLVTTSISSIEFGEFLNFLKEEANKTKSSEIKLEPKEILNLFKTRPSYTKNFEDKLFIFDDYTAITTAGAASINNKRISEIVSAVVNKNKKDKNYNRKGIETKVKNFCKSIESEIKDHLHSKTSIRPTRFILTHYDKNKKKSLIYKIDVNSASKKDLETVDFKFTSYKLVNDWEKVVCDGQNRISERILYGAIGDVYDLIPKITSKVIEDLKINIDDIPKDYIKKLSEDKNIVSPNLFEEMKIFKLSNLSLQQAVDLASLLMRLEIDFQTYTENIPSVGGVIKVAIIDKNGFKFISGNEVLKPNNL
ncbi:MAG: hypothetical protein GY936_19870 [Ignavibacteriae bacterium]|nr:hypothetical protein [Ignavibacteriota bacterium]